MTFSKNYQGELAKKLIADLAGAGINYSRIARRTGVSASTIQKLASMDNRAPRYQLLQSLMAYYQKIFATPNNYPFLKEYFESHHLIIQGNLMLIDKALNQS